LASFGKSHSTVHNTPGNSPVTKRDSISE
jgi:hypothetical protein